MKRIQRLLLTVPLLFIPFACQDRDPMLPDMTTPQSALVEVPGFHFRSPLGQGGSTAGLLGTLSPTVTICQAPSGTCGPTIAQFTLTSGLRVLPDNIYQVDWNTTGTADGAYKIIVELGGELLGTADITLVANAGQAKKAGGDTFALVNGRTLPIKFGVELQALLAVLDVNDVPGDDFVVETFNTTENDQRATVPSGDAAFEVDGEDVQLPAGYQGSNFTLLIYEAPRGEDGECVTSYGGPSTGNCYVYKTIPEDVTFYEGGDLEAQVPAGLGGVCPDENVTDEFRLAKEDNGVTTFPEEALEDVVNCSEIALDRVPRLLRPLARLFLPSALHANDIGETGTMGSFSTLFYGVPVELEPASPLPTGPSAAGDELSLSFRVVTAHNHDETPNPVSGVTVAFSIPTGAGSLSVESATSDPNGVVQVTWTLPTTPGNATLTVTVLGGITDDNGPTTFAFNATVGVDMIVWNDVNTFDATGMVDDDDDNIAFVQNLVNFTGSGSRASGTKVLLDRGRSSSFASEAGAAFEAALSGAGLTIVSSNSSAGSLTSIDNAVKVIFLIGPEQNFTTLEVNTLKQFAADGGRIVLIGEHGGFTTTLSVQNNLLAALGSAATNIGGALNCGFHDASPSQMGSHQIMTGVSGLTYACMSALSLGPNDVALLQDNDLFPDDAQPDGVTCAGNCVLAAATKISTMPILAVAGAGATGSFEVSSKANAGGVQKVLTQGIGRE
jgi:hypothetical protein